MPTGNQNQTLRYDDTNGWEASDLITNTGTRVGVGNTNPSSKFHIKTKI